MVTRSKNRKNSPKKAWTTAQKKSFLETGDIYASAPSYKNSVFSEFSATVGQQLPPLQQVQPAIPVGLPQGPIQPPPPPLLPPPLQPPPPPQPPKLPQPRPPAQPPPLPRPQPDDTDSEESDDEGQDTVVRREDWNDDHGDDSDSDVTGDDPNLSWRTASAGPSEANTPIRQPQRDLDETVTSFLAEKYNFRPSPGSSPTLPRAGPSPKVEAPKPRAPQPGPRPGTSRGFAFRPPLLRPPILQGASYLGPELPPELDQAFSELGAPSSSRTRSRTGPLPEEVLHQPAPGRKKK